MPEPPQDDLVGLAEVLEWLTSRARDPSKCYRCWQVQEDESKQRKATCVVLHNPGGDHEWKCVSCDECALRDSTDDGFTRPSRVIARLVA